MTEPAWLWWRASRWQACGHSADTPRTLGGPEEAYPGDGWLILRGMSPRLRRRKPEPVEEQPAGTGSTATATVANPSTDAADDVSAE